MRLMRPVEAFVVMMTQMSFTSLRGRRYVGNDKVYNRIIMTDNHVGDGGHDCRVDGRDC